ncbi:hypothetical protein AAY473_007805 [Plecturocebus cupreus]
MRTRDALLSSQRLVDTSRSQNKAGASGRARQLGRARRSLRTRAPPASPATLPEGLALGGARVPSARVSVRPPSPPRPPRSPFLCGGQITPPEGPRRPPPQRGRTGIRGPSRVPGRILQSGWQRTCSGTSGCPAAAEARTFLLGRKMAGPGKQRKLGPGPRRGVCGSRVRPGSCVGVAGACARLPAARSRSRRLAALPTLPAPARSQRFSKHPASSETRRAPTEGTWAEQWWPGSGWGCCYWHCSYPRRFIPIKQL